MQSDCFSLQKSVRWEDLVLFFTLKITPVSSCIIATHEKDWWNRQVACFGIISFINSDELGINVERKGSLASLEPKDGLALEGIFSI